MREANQDLRQQGSALLELIVVLPTLLALGIVAVELIRMLSRAHIASLTSRDAARMAFQECIGEFDRDRSNACLAAVARRVERFSADNAGNVALAISIYRCDSAANCKAVRRIGYAPAAGHQSRFQILGGAEQGSRLDNSELSAGVAGLRAIVVAEAFLPYEPVLPSFAGFFSLPDGVIFDVTVI